MSSNSNFPCAFDLMWPEHPRNLFQSMPAIDRIILLKTHTSAPILSFDACPAYPKECLPMAGHCPPHTNMRSTPKLEALDMCANCPSDLRTMRSSSAADALPCAPRHPYRGSGLILGRKAGMRLYFTRSRSPEGFQENLPSLWGCDFGRVTPSPRHSPTAILTQIDANSGQKLPLALLSASNKMSAAVETPSHPRKKTLLILVS